MVLLLVSDSIGAMTTLEAIDSSRQIKTKNSYQLSPEETVFFHANGYLGPFALCTPAEMAEIRRKIDAEIWDATDFSNNIKVEAGQLGGRYRSSHPRQGLARHLDNRTVYELCSHPAVVDRVASLMGPDLMIWRSAFFNKEPGGAAIPWHQDLNYWPLEPVINVTAWLAIDEVTTENSCVQIIPGSHKKSIPHTTGDKDAHFQESADLSSFDPSKAINMELKPGEFFLFTEKLLHYSAPNRSNMRRMGLAIRNTVPWVRVDSKSLGEDHYNLILRGEDRFGFNRIGTPPESD